MVNDSSIRRLLNAQPKVKITIPAGQSEHEQLPVDVQIHGYNFRIRRGCEVEVPEAVVHVLQNALAMHIHMRPRENGEGMERVFSEGHRFPFQMRA